MNTSTTVNHVSAADVPTKDHADQEGIRDGRLPPHVYAVFTKVKTFHSSDDISAAPSLQTRFNRRTTSCECYAWIVAPRRQGNCART